MSQHKASRRATLISAMKHKFSANLWLDTMEELTANIAVARAKVLADTNSTWDTDYLATAGVTAVDFDSPTVGQNKSPARKVIIDKLCHKRLGDEVTNLLEESQVTLNLILAQMDADAGTLSSDAVYEAFRIVDPITTASVLQGPHKVSFVKVMISAIKHKVFGTSIATEMAAIQSELNQMITDIQAAN